MPDVDNTPETPQNRVSDISSAPWKSGQLTRKPRWLKDYVPSSSRYLQSYKLN